MSCSNNNEAIIAYAKKKVFQFEPGQADNAKLQNTADMISRSRIDNI